MVKVTKVLKISLMIILGFLCTQVTMPKSETKIANENMNKTLDLNAMAIKIDEIFANDLYKPIDTFNGDLTGYSADCPLCSGLLGCTGQNVLIDRTTTYMDDQYGEVRIVASSKNLPCGSIVEFNLPSISNNKITAIVLDRGVMGTDLDLLVENEDYARLNIGRKYITYNVLRIGRSS